MTKKMFVYSNNSNNHQNHKTIAQINQKVSTRRAVKVKASSKKRKSRKHGKSLSKVNTQFLKALGFMVRKRQKTK